MNKRSIAKGRSSGVGRGGARALRKPQVTVLHIDDDANDTELLRAAATRAGAPFVLHNVADAEHAMAYLNGQNEYADRARYALPSLILLDLKMPRASGFEILKWIRSQPRFLRVPVVVLSGSELRDDIRLAYATGANSYLVKPLGFDALVLLVKNLSSVWLNPRVPADATRPAQLQLFPRVATS